MLKLQGIQKNAAILGIDPGPVVRVITTELVDDNALTAYYKTADGKLLDRMLLRTDTANLFLPALGVRYAWRGVQTGGRGLSDQPRSSV